MTSYEEEDNFAEGDYGSVPKYQQFQVNYGSVPKYQQFQVNCGSVPKY